MKILFQFLMKLALLWAAFSAQAQQIKAPDELFFASVTASEGDATNARYSDFLAYLTKEIGIPVKIKHYKNYAELINSQRAGETHIASYGSSSFARAISSGVKTTAFAAPVNNGGLGYYSVLYVKANSPYQRLDDLKGKTMVFVDPDSTSGNMVPRLTMHKMGIQPESFFGRIEYAGSHDKAVLALANGNADVVANAWNSETSSVLQRMSKAGQVNKDDYRILVKSDLIVNGPIAYLDSLPSDLKEKIQQAFLSAHAKNKAAFEKMVGENSEPFQPVNSLAYQPIVELNQFIDGISKKQ